ncbi:MAG: DNA translocase FtsK 4TM domain-containing protein [Akkermansia sp.]
MAFEDRQKYGYEPPSRTASIWKGRIWGGVSILGGILFFACLFTYRLVEVQWSALNTTGHSITTCSNFLGVAGVYIAAIAYWLLGGGVWFLWAYLIWTGIYRVFHGGQLPKSMVYTGLSAVMMTSIFMATQSWMGQEWASQQCLMSLGGSIGYLFGSVLLQRFLGTGGTICLCLVGYFTLFIYALGTHPTAVGRGLKNEWVKWLEYRRKKRSAKTQSQREERERLEQEKAREATREKARQSGKKISVFRSMEQDSSLSTSASSLVASTTQLERSPRKKRTGDDLSALDAPPKANQTELGLKYEPKIVDASHVKTMPAQGEKPFPVPMTEALQGFENYVLPGYDLLKVEEKQEEQTEADKAELVHTQNVIIDTLRSFGVDVTAGNITRGPTITRYEIYPTSGLRVSQITKLEPDIARATKAVRINILAPIPGRDTVGIEIANAKKVAVSLQDLLKDPAFSSPSKKIPVALGKDVYGNTVIGDLAAMPHLLVAGTTGSGKSVCINCLIASMLFKFRPDELRFILVDPKVVEMQPYSKLPHLIVPVVTDPKKVIGALRWCVNEMERRYRLFAEVGVRNFDAFNKRPKNVPIEEEAPEEDDDAVDADLIEAIANDFESQADSPDSPSSLWADNDDDEEDVDTDVPDRFPYVVIIIDELADLMQTVKDDIELYIGRLTQKARAAGIHLIVATQTPRSEVVTGIIKSNIPCRIAFQVSSGLDSRIILDQPGAEKLVGKGDLLYLPPGSAKLERAQGAFISDEEVEGLVAHCASQAKQDFHACIQKSIENGDAGNDDIDEGDEEIFKKAVEIVRVERKASISLLQRRLHIGYGKSARVIELMERRGVVGPSDGSSRPREVLLPNNDD